jgi:hypothetical protein
MSVGRSSPPERRSLVGIAARRSRWCDPSIFATTRKDPIIMRKHLGTVCWTMAICLLLAGHCLAGQNAAAGNEASPETQCWAQSDPCPGNKECLPPVSCTGEVECEAYSNHVVCDGTPVVCPVTVCPTNFACSESCECGSLGACMGGRCACMAKL